MNDEPFLISRAVDDVSALLAARPPTERGACGDARELAQHIESERETRRQEVEVRNLIFDLQHTEMLQNMVKALQRDGANESHVVRHS